MSHRLVIVLPMAGWGTRMRPHTWNKPKALCRVAGKTVLDYVLRQFEPLHELFEEIEYIFILSSEEHQAQIEEHIQKRQYQQRIHYVQQTVMNGQSPAIKLAERFLDGPMILAFADTLVETDFSVIQRQPTTALAWGVRVNEPEHYGIAEIDEDGTIKRLKEKPKKYIGNLAMAGTYYFPNGLQLISAIDRQMARGIHKDEEDPKDGDTREFYIVPTINILIREDNLPLRVVETPAMYDAGRPAAIIETNLYLLRRYWKRQQGQFLTRAAEDVIIEPPVFIGENVTLKNAIIGPNVSIGDNVVIDNAEISHSIIGEGCQINRLRMKNSLLGDRVQIVDTRLSVKQFNLGDDAQSVLEHSGDRLPKNMVECHSSATYAERPVSVVWSGERLQIDAIMSRWRTQSGRGFRVRTVDTRQFTLFYDEATDQWQVDLFADRTR
ncbi:MAG: NDP-sugar synthase [Anaerolineae bacterium]|nr:NDP-sugar synthase [Anaerolineae bacterium]